MKYLVVGAGLSGAVISRQLAEAGHSIDVVELRPYVGGNCYTEIDEATGVMVHKHGPHIFHTDDEEVWNYLLQFGEFGPYIGRVKATTGGRVFSLPINLLTINQFFDKAMNPNEAEKFIADQADKSIVDIVSFKDQALHMLGRDLYEAFFEGYTKKQWGIDPQDLPASILKRLPVRFNYDDNYFNHKFQGMPVEGYTKIIERILTHPNISLSLNTDIGPNDVQGYDHVFYSGPIDAWFGHSLGRLGYRTLDFETSYHEGDYQGCAVMNYPDESVPFTRVTEHKHFTPWDKFDRTIVFHEFSRDCEPEDVPYYPIRLISEKKMLRDYVDLAKQEKNITFVGRLGTYRYLDMDVTIREALDVSNGYLNCIQSGKAAPVFFVDPI